MTPQELLHAAEAKLRDAEGNLATCVATINEHKARHGGVPNPEIVQLAHAQTAVAQTYATLALAKAGIALAEGTPKPDTTVPWVSAGVAEANPRCIDPACPDAAVVNHAHMSDEQQQAALAEVIDALGGTDG